VVLCLRPMSKNLGADRQGVALVRGDRANVRLPANLGVLPEDRSDLSGLGAGGPGVGRSFRPPASLGYRHKADRTHGLAACRARKRINRRCHRAHDGMIAPCQENLRSTL